MKPKISILTDTVPNKYTIIFMLGMRFLSLFRHSIKLRFLNLRFGGHYAVTRSLVEGLTKIGAPFNYNPKKISDLADIVHVVGGVKALKQMINYKKLGIIKKLYAGPNIVLFSTEAKSILASNEIDGVVNHSDWACQFWANDFPHLLSRCFIWPAGVDTEYWIPNYKLRSKTILIFDKRNSEDDPKRIQPYVNFLAEKGWAIKILTRSTTRRYTAKQYKSLLQKCVLLIGFTVGSESQGIAWAEAWSCDVTTLIQKNTFNIYKGRKYFCSTAPYLNSNNGIFFDDFINFKMQFDFWELNQNKFNPRAWVLNNMSDEICAKNLFSYISS